MRIFIKRVADFKEYEIEDQEALSGLILKYIRDMRSLKELLQDLEEADWVKNPDECEPAEQQEMTACPPLGTMRHSPKASLRVMQESTNGKMSKVVSSLKGVERP